jgi:microcystin-dependent protein
MSPLRSILNDTPATAVDVDWNFQTVEDHIATEVINRDGSVAMAAPLNLLGAAPSLATHAVPKSYVDATVLPVGIIWQFAGATAPAGWWLCDGSSQSTTDPRFVALFALIQYTYGGSGGTFNLPNLKGRMPVGRDSSVSVFDTLGEKGGNRNSPVVTHTHPIDHNHAAATTDAGGSHAHAVNIAKTNTGGWSTKGDPVGWNVDLGGGVSNVLYGEAAALRQMSLITHPGSGFHFSSAPPGWFQEQGYVDPPSTNTDTEPTHTHGINLPTFTGASGAASNDESGTDRNIPPYLVINFIIRIG